MANRFTVGDIEVLVVSDGPLKFPPHMYFAGTTPEQWQSHKRWLDHEGNIEFPMACFLVRSGDRVVLIDTGLGSAPMFTFKGGALLGELAAAGVKPEEIDTVFVTHLHVDHCGTCARDGDDGLRPTFPNAVYRWTQQENDFWLEAPDPPATTFSVKAMLASLAGRFEAADDGATIAPGMTVMATPGHTPGHASVVLSSGDERAFIMGDAIACPAQLEETEWSGLGDLDPKLARRTQEALADEIEANGGVLAAAHFPGLQFGRVLRGEGRRYWQPV